MVAWYQWERSVMLSLGFSARMKGYYFVEVDQGGGKAVGVIIIFRGSWTPL